MSEHEWGDVSCTLDAGTNMRKTGLNKRETYPENGALCRREQRAMGLQREQGEETQ